MIQQKNVCRLRSSQSGVTRPIMLELIAGFLRSAIDLSLLFVADHAPIGEANEILSRRFDVEMSKVHTSDPAHADLNQGGNEGWIVYSRENGWLGNHPITEGETPPRGSIV